MPEFAQRTRSLKNESMEGGIWQASEKLRTVDWQSSGLLLCDVWDNHWCSGAVRRLEAMLPRMDAVIGHVRDAGGSIIHAPSDTMDFYENFDSRLRIQEAPSTSIPSLLDHEDPPLPFDDTNGGCDTEEKPWTKVWTRQHPGIGIDEAMDVVSDNGDEIYRWLVHRGLKTLLIAGVHTNMCVMNRSFGIKRMVRLGVDVILVRDLTDTMYDPSQRPYVSHEEGTNLMVSFIESFWCPTVSSDQILGD